MREDYSRASSPIFFYFRTIIVIRADIIIIVIITYIVDMYCYTYRQLEMNKISIKGRRKIG